ncbi:MAG: hypothetical protein AB1763_04770 [Campylobacterota bacterium]
MRNIIRKIFSNWWKSKTQVFNAMLVAVGLIEANTGEFRSLVGDDNYGFFIVAIGVMGWYLRTVTTKSMKDK